MVAFGRSLTVDDDTSDSLDELLRAEPMLPLDCRQQEKQLPREKSYLLIITTFQSFKQISLHTLDFPF